MVVGFDTHAEHVSLLKLGQFHLLTQSAVNEYQVLPTLLGRYLRWTSILSTRVSTTTLKVACAK